MNQRPTNPVWMARGTPGYESQAQVSEPHQAIQIKDMFEARRLSAIEYQAVQKGVIWGQ